MVALNRRSVRFTLARRPVGDTGAARRERERAASPDGTGPGLHELGHVRMEAALVRHKQRFFYDRTNAVLALHGQADSQQAGLQPADTDAPAVKEFIQRLLGKWTSDYADVSRTAGSLKDKLDHLWAYTRLFEQDAISPQERDGYLAAVEDARNVWETLQSFFAGARRDVDTETRALADLQAAPPAPQGSGFRPELRDQCVVFLKSCDQLFWTGQRMLKDAIEYGGSSRYVEYFWLLALKSNFPEFTAYARTSVTEWFAETYQLATPAPDDLARLRLPMAKWFVTRQLAFPLHLKKFTSSEFPSNYG
ncbi:hypothetical protein [Streptomyces sp. YIM S03343]